MHLAAVGMDQAVIMAVVVPVVRMSMSVVVMCVRVKVVVVMLVMAVAVVVVRMAVAVFVAVVVMGMFAYPMGMGGFERGQQGCRPVFDRYGGGCRPGRG